MTCYLTKYEKQFNNFTLLSKWRKISCLCPRFFDCHQYQEGSADATEQLTASTVLYEEEPVSSVCNMFGVLTLQLNFLESFAICKFFPIFEVFHNAIFVCEFVFFINTRSWKPLNCKQLNYVETSISLTCPANSPQTPTMQRMLKTAEPTMVPTPTSP